jgi:HK97 gp10 family phage protein
MAAPKVHVVGLRELRSALRAIDTTLPREINAALREAVQPIASDARSSAPHLTGALARSVRAGATARGAFIGARAQHAGIHEFGGTIRFLTRRAQIRIRPQPYIRPAVEAGTDDAIERIGDHVDALTQRHGFR